ncbi:MAG: tRNA isopentenyl-2-thiomethyl-A-37 hydroxylase MiaE [SAR86 cluster bacterium]|nr:tRNA isopentenyl-2-thiomethyl-A-37 hydroxylase MiaE [SAR86 cluster bacterium]
MEEEPLHDKILLAKTSQDWIYKAINNLEILLLDHAHCEKKAATTAISLINRYPEKGFAKKLSSLAREELMHFEKVCRILTKRGFTYRNLKAGPYAKSLYQLISPSEPKKLQDSLLICALIESRSSERFFALNNYLPTDLQDFYHKLYTSEVRHSNLYIGLYVELFGKNWIDPIKPFSEAEAKLISEPDSLFRFHSGI